MDKKLRNRIRYSLLGFGSMVYLGFLGYIAWFKWKHFLYNEIDLAIFGQILAQMGPGSWFDNSIQQVNYFGDHVIPILLLLAPIYKVFNTAFFLVLFQIGLIFAAAVILFKYIQNIFKLDFLSTLLLVTPFVLFVSTLTMAVHGFHMLPLFFLLYFSLWFFYKKEKFWWYLCFVIAILLLREDMPLIIASFALIPAVEKRSVKWWLTPAILGVAYFFLAQYISGLVNATGGGKFMVYYAWMGTTPVEILTYMITKPFSVLVHVFQYSNIAFLIATFLPFSVAIWKKWYWVIPAITYMGVFMLVEVPDMILVYVTHYMAPILGVLVIAYIEGFMSLPDKFRKMSIATSLAGIILVHQFLGLPYVLRALGHEGLVMKESEYEEVWKIIDGIEDGDHILASTAFLPYFVDHANLYNLVYAFPGKTQYELDDYRIEQVDYALIDTTEITAYYLQHINEINHPNFHDSAQRMQELFTKNKLCISSIVGDIYFYQSGYCISKQDWGVQSKIDRELDHFLLHELQITKDAYKRLSLQNMGENGDWYGVRWKHHPESIAPLGGGMQEIYTASPDQVLYHYFRGCGELEFITDVDGYNYFDAINHRRQEFLDVKVVDTIEIPCE